ncbi:MAG: hypothetical protein KGI90_12320 [Burkholderiales bacterium]|nr:hypothetical protein [Burkholderiales bacterium]
MEAPLTSAVGLQPPRAVEVSRQDVVKLRNATSHDDEAKARTVATGIEAFAADALAWLAATVARRDRFERSERPIRVGAVDAAGPGGLTAARVAPGRLRL